MPNYPVGRRPLCPKCERNEIKAYGSQQCVQCYKHPGWFKEAPKPEPAENIVTTPTCYEDAWAQWRREIGQATEHYSQPEPHSGHRERIVVLSDIHSPWHEPAMLAGVLAREKGKADRCVILGDLDDAYAVSRFVQYEWMPFRDSWATTTLLLEQIASTFPRVDVVIGNHDARLEKQILSRLTPDMVEAVRFLTGGTLCPLTALTRRYPNVHVAKHELRDGRTLDWLCAIGDAMLLHPEKYSRVPGSALRGVEEWIADQSAGFAFPEARLIVMGHTHQYAAIPWHSDTLLIEAGCLCQTQGYMTTARIGGRPQRRGYLAFTQQGGVTDLNSVHFHSFDFEDQEIRMAKGMALSA